VGNIGVEIGVRDCIGYRMRRLGLRFESVRVGPVAVIRI
jgi:hypothetical protein